MPNWCGNTVIVDGGKREIARFVKYVENSSTEEPFSFQAILPMPKELVETTSPIRIVTQKDYNNYELSSHGFDVAKPITQEMSDRFIKQYGTNNWYDWAIVNWGTKWNVRGDEIQTSLEPTHLNYSFDTAWGPPKGIYEELVKQFPKLTINWHYREEGMEVFGNLATDQPRKVQAATEDSRTLTKLLYSLSKENNNATI